MHDLLSKFDSRLSLVVQSWPPGVRPYMIMASIVGLPIVTISVGSIIALLGMIYENMSLFYTGALAVVALGLGSLLKLTLRRKRPLTDYVLSMKIKSFSFPSGHSLGSVVSFGLLAYMAWHTLPLSIGIIIAALVLLLCFFIGASRVYLGAHYPSDVIAGWLLGLLSIIVIVICIRPSL